jgi:purine nucleosidase/pyrimidine-specific ribonucleoside hydrolase
MRLLIDTDPGIDDAIAILFALKHPAIEVQAITTVAGNIGLPLTTRNALRLVALSGRPVPVYAGAAALLHRPGVQELAVHGADGIGGVRLPEPVSAIAGTDAAGFLAQTLLAHPPGTFDLCALGPLTNIAALIEAAPQAARRIGRLIAMGGTIEESGNVGPRSEFNLANDPEAARLVLAAGLDLILIPLDVTRRVRADAGWLAGLPATPQGQAVRALTGAYFDRTSDAARPTSRPLHDPCVPALALRPDLFETRAMALDVDCSAGPAAGALAAGPYPLRVAMGVDGAGVLALIAETLR